MKIFHLPTTYLRWEIRPCVLCILGLTFSFPDLYYIYCVLFFAVLKNMYVHYIFKSRRKLQSPLLLENKRCRTKICAMKMSALPRRIQVRISSQIYRVFVFFIPAQLWTSIFYQFLLSARHYVQKQNRHNVIQV